MRKHNDLVSHIGAGASLASGGGFFGGCVSGPPPPPLRCPKPTLTQKKKTPTLPRCARQGSLLLIHVGAVTSLASGGGPCGGCVRCMNPILPPCPALPQTHPDPKSPLTPRCACQGILLLSYFGAVTYFHSGGGFCAGCLRCPTMPHPTAPLPAQTCTTLLP